MDITKRLTNPLRPVSHIPSQSIVFIFYSLINFDLRSSIYKISKKNLDLIHTARHFGASSKFCGSGGAIVGIYNSDEQFENMRKAFKKLNASIIKPQIFEDEKSNLINWKAASNN